MPEEVLEQVAEAAELAGPTDYQKWVADEAAKEGQEPEPAKVSPVVEEVPAADEPAEEKKKMGGWQRKLAKSDARIRELEAALQERGGKPTTPAPAPVVEKHPDDMTVPEMIQYEVRKAKAEWEAEAAVQTTSQRWNARKEELRGTLDDFDECYDAAVAIFDQVAVPVNEFLMVDSTHGVELVHWLGSNPEEAKRIAGLRPTAAIAELAKIEARFDSAAEKSRQPKPAIAHSQAPRGPKPVSGTTSESGKEPDPKDYLAWRHWYEGQLARTGRDR